ncbi:MAG TPA: YoaK family protein [Streptosporangiaceae bacterium]
MTAPGPAPFLPGLALVAATTDAINFLGLGRVFTANMTGNTVLLGVGVASGDHTAALRSATALGGFLLGTAVGAAIGGQGRSFATALGVELGVIIAWYAWWAAAGSAPRYGYVALSGVAMGIQSGAVTRLRVPGVSTTFITGTMTSFSVQLVDRLLRRRPAPPGSTQPLRAVVLPCYVAGAFAGGYAFHFLGSGAVIVPLGVLAVLTAAAFLFPPARQEEEAGATATA